MALPHSGIVAAAAAAARTCALVTALVTALEMALSALSQHGQPSPDEGGNQCHEPTWPAILRVASTLLRSGTVKHALYVDVSHRPAATISGGLLVHVLR